jgi:hypothetical protein
MVTEYYHDRAALGYTLGSHSAESAAMQKRTEPPSLQDLPRVLAHHFSNQRILLIAVCGSATEEKAYLFAEETKAKE